MSIADSARKLPGVAKVEGTVRGTLADADDLPIRAYYEQTADAIIGKLKGLSQRELRMVDAYERRHQSRETITDKIRKLSGDEPWAGYDEQDANEVVRILRETDPEAARVVRSYERDHKGRSSVIEAADRRIG